jgi:hypothetical protein
VDLLPKWDCYTMGYAPDGHRTGAGASWAREARACVYNAAGEGLDVVLVDSAPAGAWEAGFVGGAGRMRVDLDLFERPGVCLKNAIEDRFEAAVAFLEARSVSLD